MKSFETVKGVSRFVAARRARRKIVALLQAEVVASHRWAGAFVGLLCYHAFMLFIIARWPLRFLHWKTEDGGMHLTLLVLPRLGWIVHPLGISFYSLAMPLALVFAGHFIGKTQPIGFLNHQRLRTVLIILCALMIIVVPLTLLVALCVES